MKRMDGSDSGVLAALEIGGSSSFAPWAFAAPGRQLYALDTSYVHARQSCSLNSTPLLR